MKVFIYKTIFKMDAIFILIGIAVGMLVLNAGFNMGNNNNKQKKDMNEFENLQTAIDAVSFANENEIGDKNLNKMFLSAFSEISELNQSLAEIRKYIESEKKTLKI